MMRANKVKETGMLQANKGTYVIHRKKGQS